MALQLLEKLAFAGIRVLATEHLHRSGDNGHRPGTVEQLVGRQSVSGLQRVASLRLLEFQRQDAVAAAAPSSLGLTILVGHEVLQ